MRQHSGPCSAGRSTLWNWGRSAPGESFPKWRPTVWRVRPAGRPPPPGGETDSTARGGQIALTAAAEQASFGFPSSPFVYQQQLTPSEPLSPNKIVPFCFISTAYLSFASTSCDRLTINNLIDRLRGLAYPNY